MRRIIRLIILLIVIVGLAWAWKTNNESLKSFKDRAFAEVVVIYQRFFPKRSELKSFIDIAQIPDKTIVWCASQCFWFSRDGVILAESPKTEGSLIKTAETSLTKEYKVGDQALPSDEAKNLYAIVDIMRQFDFNFSRIDLGDLSLKEAVITLESGPKFYFSLKFSSDFAVPVIESLIKSGEISNLQYIDFRMENRAYYK